MRIPEFTRRQVLSTADPGRIDSAVQSGKNVSGVFDAISQVAAKQEHARDSSWLAQASTDLRESFMNTHKEFKNQFQDDPLKENDFVANGYKKISEQIGKNAPSQEAKSAYSKLSERLQLNFGQKWADHASRKSSANNLKAYGRGVEQLSNMALEAEGLDDYRSILEDGNRRQLALEQERPLSNEDREELRSKRSSLLAQNFLYGMLDKGKISKAKELIRDEKFSSDLGPDGVRKIKRQIKSEESRVRTNSNKLLSMKFKDPYQFVEKTSGAVPEPLSFNGSMKDGISRRMRFRESMEEKGVRLPLLTKQEEEYFKGTFSQLNTEDQIAFIGSYARELMPEEESLFVEQVFKNNPQAAISMSLIEESEDVAVRILKGKKVLDTKAISLPTLKQVSEEIRNHVGDAVVNPEHISAFAQGALSLYAESVSKSGLTDAKDIADSGSEVFESAVSDLVGPVVEINGMKTLSFRDEKGKFVDADEIESTWSRLSPKFLESLKVAKPKTARGEEVPFEKVISMGRLQVEGDGLYSVLIPDPKSGLLKHLEVSKGEQYTIDLKMLHQNIPEEFRPKSLRQGF